jgi:hypothetical protein
MPFRFSTVENGLLKIKQLDFKRVSTCVALPKNVGPRRGRPRAIRGTQIFQFVCVCVRMHAEHKVRPNFGGYTIFVCA